MRPSLLIVAFVLSFSSLALARPDRPNQIPNGTIHRCATCHLDPGGGGLRTPFGYTVEDGFLLPDATVDWGPALAAIDSDGDGRSNGQELQDPTGSWRRGQPQPGDPALVTNPGVAQPRVPALTVWMRAGLGLALAFALSARRLRAWRYC
jgi:hypothetical protein